MLSTKRTKYQITKKPEVAKELAKAIEERASYMYAVSGADQYVINALATLAGGARRRAR